MIDFSQLNNTNALMPVQAFQAGREQRDTRLAGEAQNALLADNREQAMGLAQRTGNADVMRGLQEQIAQMDEAQRTEARNRANAFGQVGAGLLQVPYEQRRAALSNPQVQQQLSAFGIDPQQLAGFDPTDENLYAALAPVAEISDLLDRTAPMSLGANDTRVDPVSGQQIVGQAGVETRQLREQELGIQQQNADTARVRASQPRGPLVTVNGAQPVDPFQARMAEAEADQFAGFIETGMTANRNLMQIGRLEELLSTSPQGFDGAVRLVLGDLGINSEGLDQAQAARALINQLVPQQRPAGSGPMSDADLALFMQSLPRIINQPNGNARIIQTIRQINEYDATLGRIAQEVASGRMNREQAREAVNALQNPLEWVRRSGTPQQQTTDSEVSDDELFRILSGQ